MSYATSRVNASDGTYMGRLRTLEQLIAFNFAGKKMILPNNNQQDNILDGAFQRPPFYEPLKNIYFRNANIQFDD
jgi:hypothetical protein